MPPEDESTEKPGSLSFFRRAEKEKLEPAPGLTAGKVVGDFRLVALLGQGGMGQVWEAEQVSLHRRVAVKFVRPERVTEHHLELFAREARAGGRLHHPGIVTVHGHGQSDGLAWIAMEFVSGAWTLKDFLDDVARAAEVPEGYDRHVARFVVEIADAMQAAHEAAVIHRDLKPQNVLITSDDHPKVTDFGLARITDETAMSQTGDFAGTYFYMSPEQVTARRMGIDHRTDVFSLGVVLYELLALRRPFEGDTSHQIATQIVTKDPPDIRTIRSRVPRDLAVIAGKALEKDRDKRFQSMKDLAADLRRFLADEPIHARPPTRLDRAVKWTRRNPGKSSAAAIVAVTFTIIALLLAANVRTNRALSAERTNLAQANLALEAKTAESEERRLSAEQAAGRERIAAEAATRRADEVLRLSALQELDDIVAEADRLWPAHPENIERYEAWLARAQDLVAELPTHQATLEELRARARPWSSEEDSAHLGSHPEAKVLESARRRLAHLRGRSEALEAGVLPADPTPAEAGVDWGSLPTDAGELNDLAWPLIDPERKEWGSEAKGLLLARRAIELASHADRHPILDTLAWALFAVGRFEEAIATAEEALEAAPFGEKAEFRGYVDQLEKAVAAELDPVQGARNLAAVEAEVAALERELESSRPRTFDDPQDRWWHDQLVKLVNGIASLAQPSTGLMSAGISAEHGWGMKKRLDSAHSLRDRFAGGEVDLAWRAALPEIHSAYPGLALTPQLGLVPIGPDLDSGLWEFAHLPTGEIPKRDGDWKLVLTEETGLVFVLLPGGTFLMGAQSRDPAGPNYDPKTDSREGPVHEVTLSPFFLSKYEMTQGQWSRFTGSNPSAYDRERYHKYWNARGEEWTSLHPVERVNWWACSIALDRLGLQLPTEAQWEYGSRAGTSTVFWCGDEKESLRGVANLLDSYAKSHGSEIYNLWEPWLDDGQTQHASVGSYAPNAFGLHDVIGNVWEWCWDGYSESFYSQSSSKDPLCDPAALSPRVYRGGSFASVASGARSADRLGGSPEFAGGALGVRPARRISP